MPPNGQKLDQEQTSSLKLSRKACRAITSLLNVHQLCWGLSTNGDFQEGLDKKINSEQPHVTVNISINDQTNLSLTFQVSFIK